VPVVLGVVVQRQSGGGVLIVLQGGEAATDCIDVPRHRYRRMTQSGWPAGFTSSTRVT
jgi:hypothetical protein